MNFGKCSNNKIVRTEFKFCNFRIEIIETKEIISYYFLSVNGWLGETLAEDILKIPFEELLKPALSYNAIDQCQSIFYIYQTLAFLDRKDIEQFIEDWLEPRLLALYLSQVDGSVI